MSLVGIEEMELEAFPTFTPFLVDLAEFAKGTGYRFRSSDFVKNDLSESSKARVEEYKKIIVDRDPAAMKDVMKAAKLSEQEALRKVMVATCKELELWPPTTKDRLHSISYQDTSEPLDAIAWSLYNHDKGIHEIEESSLAHGRLVRTAAFIVDFVHAIEGMNEITRITPTGSDMLKQFLARVNEYTRPKPEHRKGIRRAIKRHLRELTDDKFILDVEKWLDRNWPAVAVGGIALAAGMAIAALAFGLSNNGK